MLTDTDKQRIKEEEIFRAEIQRELIKPQNKVIKFLNTSLGIWLLSTLALGLYAWAYSRIQATQQNEDTVRRLDIEIEARIASSALQLETIVNNGQSVSKVFVWHLLSAPNNDRAVQNEFSNRNLRSLLYDLNGRVYHVERYFIRRAIDDVRKLEIDYLEKDLTPEDTVKLRDAVFDLYLTRWGSDGMAQQRRVRIVNWTALGFVIGIPLLIALLGIFGFRFLKKRRMKGTSARPDK